MNTGCTHLVWHYLRLIEMTCNKINKKLKHETKSKELKRCVPKNNSFVNRYTYALDSIFAVIWVICFM